MARIKHTKEQHLAEFLYITTAWAEDKGAYRNNEATFNEYVEMQAKAALADGYECIAEDMLMYRVVVPQSKRV